MIKPPLLGFTLVELLVVIVIIATLASIAFIVSKRAIKSAHQATAMSNMKQLSNLIANRPETPFGVLLEPSAIPKPRS